MLSGPKILENNGSPSSCDCNRSPLKTSNKPISILIHGQATMGKMKVAVGAWETDQTTLCHGNCIQTRGHCARVIALLTSGGR